jgi:hypothetical protein
MSCHPLLQHPALYLPPSTIHEDFGSDNHVMTLAKNKPFGLAATGQRGLQLNTTEGRKWEALSGVSPSTHGTLWPQYSKSNCPHRASTFKVQWLVWWRPVTKNKDFRNVTLSSGEYIPTWCLEVRSEAVQTCWDWKSLQQKRYENPKSLSSLTRCTVLSINYKCKHMVCIA